MGERGDVLMSWWVKGGGGEGLCSFSDKGGEEEDFLMSC